MPFEKGRSGNPGGRPKAKPFKDALRMELAAIENGDDKGEVRPGSLRAIARALLLRAMANDAAQKEVADRLDGKPAQAIVGGDEGDEPVKHVLEVSWKSSAAKSSSTTPPESSSSDSTSEQSDGQSSSPTDEPEKQ